MQRLNATLLPFAGGRGAGGFRSTGQSRVRRLPLFLIFSIASLVAGFTGLAAQEPDKPDEQGVFLVARRELTNPLFGKTVILMLPKNETPLVVGLIVNKPTKVQLRDVFPDSKTVQQKETKAFFGGPVELDSPSAIFRSAAAPKNATSVFADIYVTFDPDTITELAESPEQASTLRIFLGRSQWAPEQLQNEVAEGAWYTMRGDADPIFSSHPESAWPALLKRLEPRPLVEYLPPANPVAPSL
jgi:putative transcriptional regulator